MRSAKRSLPLDFKSEKVANWIDEEGTLLDANVMVGLHGNYMNWCQGFLDSCFRVLAHYTTTMSGILVITTALVKYFQKNSDALDSSIYFLLAGPLIVIAMTVIGIKQCLRLYDKHLEALAQVVKIEAVLGFHNKLKSSQLGSFPFPGEEKFVVSPHEFVLRYNTTTDLLNDTSHVKRLIRLTFLLFIVLAFGAMLVLISIA